MLDCRFPMAPEHLVQLEDTLRCVHLHSHAETLGSGPGLLQQRVGTGVSLIRKEHALNPAVIGTVVSLDKVDSHVQGAKPFVLEPLYLDQTSTIEDVVAGANSRRKIGSHAKLAELV